jgi:hypothetical protein
MFDKAFAKTPTYPASHERFNEEFWAPFRPGGSRYKPHLMAANRSR